MTTHQRDRSRPRNSFRGAWGSVLAVALGTTALLSGSCKKSEAGAEDAVGPGYGKDDSGDEADLECRIVLRALALQEGNENIAVGLLDAEAAEVDAGGKPNILFTFQIGAGDGAAFKQLPGSAFKEVSGGLEGYQRFQFQIDLEGQDAVEIIPLLAIKDGRLFDHNRDPDGVEGIRPDVRPGANNDNYLATRDQGFVIPLDENRCPKAKCRLPGVQIQRTFAGVSLRDPTSVKWEHGVPDSQRRVFVVEKLGRIVAFPDVDEATDGDKQVFLDWENRPGQARDPEKTYNRGGRFGEFAPGWEEGFLDMALHPDWPEVPEVYVTYNTGLGDPEDRANPGEAFWNLTRFTSADGGKTLDPGSAKVLIRIRKQGLTHNAGAVLFHPVDKTLFVSVGTDGGFPFDLFQNAQNPARLFGSIIRIDVDPATRDEEVGYSIPTDNPFAGGTTPDGKAARPEVWTYGNRNPWRMSFDPDTLELWGAEIGENTREEVNIYKPGGNYGYPFFEGTACTFRGEAIGCSGNGLEPPIFELYASDAQRPDGGLVGDSVTGGFIYRGTDMPDLQGWYVFGDFITGEILAFDPSSSAKEPKTIAETGKSIATFGESPEGEIFFVNHQHREQRVEGDPHVRADGEIYRILPAACQTAPPPPLVDYAFLSADGPGSERGANAYYRSILPEKRQIETYTLAEWKEDYIGNQETIEALYHNCWDLCFWREMHCTKEIGPGVGGCWVTNWQEEEQSPVASNFNPDAGAPDLGTVCMNVSEEGYTRFYVFAPTPDADTPASDEQRLLNPFAILDDEKGDGVTEDDKKYVPHLCTPCHSGQKYRLNGSPDLGSIFREFEPSLMTLDPGVTFSKDQIEDRFFQLNESAFSANSSLNTRSPMLAYLESLYPNGTPPAVDIFGNDEFAADLVPESWDDDDSGDERIIAAKRALWHDLVNPYCMGCHRVRKVEVDFSEYDRFRGLGEEDGGEVGLFRFITGDPTDREGHPIFMPQSQWMFDRLNGPSGNLQPSDPIGQKAVAAITEWLAAIEALQPPTCAVTFVTNGPDFTVPGQDVFITGQVGAIDSGELGTWAPWDGVALDGTDFPTWRGTVELPQGADLQFKVTVVDARQEAQNECGGNPRVQWANGNNQELTVKTAASGCTQEVTIAAQDFQAAICE